MIVFFIIVLHYFRECKIKHKPSFEFIQNYVQSLLIEKTLLMKMLKKGYVIFTDSEDLII
jgi:hypothetical protein